MAKMVITIDVPDEDFNFSYYPSDCKSAQDCVQFDIDQVDAGNVSEVELFDAYLDKNSVVEFSVES